MKIICLVKFVPDIDTIEYDYENHTLIRDNVKQVINPDDACALGYILRLKKSHPEINFEIEVVSMAPRSALKQVEEILRRGVDRAVILSDPKFGGSDTLTTSRILGTYLKKAEYDVILAGTHTLDGDTAHVPSQLADLLDLPYMSSITAIDAESFLNKDALVTVETENDRSVYQIAFPAVLGIGRESKIKLPFVRYKDLELDVSDRIFFLGREELGISENEAGIKGSATKVIRTFTQVYEEKTDRIVVQNDDEGIDKVYQFLKNRGYLK